MDSPRLLMLARYSEFCDLREKLAAAFSQSKPALPALPPKSIICMTNIIEKRGARLTQVISKDRFQQKFLEKRRSGLSYFLTYVVHCTLQPDKD